MKIGINTYFFKFPASGSGQYLLHLLQALAEVDQENEYILLGPQLTSVKIETPFKFPYQVAPVPRLARRNASIEKLMWEQFTAPLAARNARVDLLYVPYFAPPYFAGSPSVVTIHDVIPLRLPQYRTDPKMRAYLQLITRAARKATLIITVSQHAKRDMIDALKIPAERIRVIYEAAGDEYNPISDPTTLSKVVSDTCFDRQTRSPPETSSSGRSQARYSKHFVTARWSDGLLEVDRDAGVCNAGTCT